MTRIKDYSLFVDRNLVTERKLPKPWGLILYLSWFQLDFNDYINDKEAANDTERINSTGNSRKTH